jgi:hypothetical protein
MTKRRRSGAEVWVAVEKMSVEDEAAELGAMTDAELDAEIRASGGDPDAINDRAADFVTKLALRRRRLAWQTTAALAERDFAEQRDAIRKKRVPLTRDELKARIKAAQEDPRFSQPVSALFRKHTMEESTDEELYILLEQIELLKARVLGEE